MKNSFGEFLFETKTVIYAGTMAHGLKDRLYGLMKDGNTITAIEADCDAEYKRKGQRDATLTAKSNIDCAVEVDYKKRANFCFSSDAEPHGKSCFEGISKVIGNTFEWKSLLKDLGFSWSSSEKAWIR